jgi:hypothetical protein
LEHEHPNRLDHRGPHGIGRTTAVAFAKKGARALNLRTDTRFLNP